MDSTYTHTHLPSIRTTRFNMDKNLDKFVCWICCSATLLQCQLNSSRSNEAICSSAIQHHQAHHKEQSVLGIWWNNVTVSSLVQRLDYVTGSHVHTRHRLISAHGSGSPRSHQDQKQHVIVLACSIGRTTLYRPEVKLTVLEQFDNGYRHSYYRLGI